MPERNEPESFIGIAFLGAAVIFAFFIFYLAAIISLLLTIVCIFAWNEERHLFGQTVTPPEARGFIIVGIIGAVVIGVFGSILESNHVISENVASNLPSIGYVVCSLGFASWCAKNEEALEASAFENRLQEVRKARELRQQQRQAEELPRLENLNVQTMQFEFASWDDEESRS